MTFSVSNFNDIDKTTIYLETLNDNDNNVKLYKQFIKYLYDCSSLLKLKSYQFINIKKLIYKFDSNDEIYIVATYSDYVESNYKEEEEINKLYSNLFNNKDTNLHPHDRFKLNCLYFNVITTNLKYINSSTNTIIWNSILNHIEISGICNNLNNGSNSSGSNNGSSGTDTQFNELDIFYLLFSLISLLKDEEMVPLQQPQPPQPPQKERERELKVLELFYKIYNSTIFNKNLYGRETAEYAHYLISKCTKDIVDILFNDNTILKTQQQAVQQAQIQQQQAAQHNNEFETSIIINTEIIKIQELKFIGLISRLLEIIKKSKDQTEYNQILLVLSTNWSHSIQSKYCKEIMVAIELQESKLYTPLLPSDFNFLIEPLLSINGFYFKNYKPLISFIKSNLKHTPAAIGSGGSGSNELGSGSGNVNCLYSYLLPQHYKTELIIGNNHFATTVSIINKLHELINISLSVLDFANNFIMCCESSKEIKDSLAIFKLDENELIKLPPTTHTDYKRYKNNLDLIKNINVTKVNQIFLFLWERIKENHLLYESLDSVFYEITDETKHGLKNKFIKSKLNQFLLLLSIDEIDKFIVPNFTNECNESPYYKMKQIVPIITTRLLGISSDHDKVILPTYIIQDILFKLVNDNSTSQFIKLKLSTVSKMFYKNTTNIMNSSIQVPIKIKFNKLKYGSNGSNGNNNNNNEHSILKSNLISYLKFKSPLKLNDSINNVYGSLLLSFSNLKVLEISNYNGQFSTDDFKYLSGHPILEKLILSTTFAENIIKSLELIKQFTSTTTDKKIELDIVENPADSVLDSINFNYKLLNLFEQQHNQQLQQGSGGMVGDGGFNFENIKIKSIPIGIGYFLNRYFNCQLSWLASELVECFKINLRQGDNFHMVDGSISNDIKTAIGSTGNWKLEIEKYYHLINQNYNKRSFKAGLKKLEFILDNGDISNFILKCLFDETSIESIKIVFSLFSPTPKSLSGSEGSGDKDGSFKLFQLVSSTKSFSSINLISVSSISGYSNDLIDWNQTKTYSFSPHFNFKFIDFIRVEQYSPDLDFTNEQVDNKKDTTTQQAAAAGGSTEKRKFDLLGEEDYDEGYVYDYSDEDDEELEMETASDGDYNHEDGEEYEDDEEYSD